MNPHTDWRVSITSLLNFTNDWKLHDDNEPSDSKFNAVLVTELVRNNQ